MPGVGLCACVLYLYAGSRGTVRVPGSNRHAVMGQGARVSMFNDISHHREGTIIFHIDILRTTTQVTTQ